MHPKLSLLVADIVKDLSVQAVGGWVAALMVATGVLWGLMMLLVRGFWEKTGKPAIKSILVATLTEHEYVTARKQEIKDGVLAWYNDPATIEERKRFVRDVIDNEVQRNDGVIHKDITQKIDAVERDFTSTVAGIRQELAKLSLSMETRDDQMRQFNQKLMERLGNIDGLLRRPSSESSSSLPAQKPDGTKR